MKNLVAIISSVLTTALLAAPSITVNSVSQDSKRTVTVSYTLSGEPAVVTMGSVATNGAAMAEKDLYVVTGDANRLLQPGTHSLKWQPPAETGFGPFDSGKVQVTLKAWATNAPPDYMVIDLDNLRVRYYTASEAVPGGVTDIRYKTDHLIMRRIPASGVRWRKGSPMDENGRMDSETTTSYNYRGSETSHYVELTNDYYIGIYPVTFRQEYWLKGCSTSNLRDGFARYSDGNYSAGNKSGIVTEDDWPVACQQWACLRNWGHRSSKGCQYYSSSTGDDVYKFWPRDGHEVPKTYTCCATCEGKSGVTNTSTIGWFRETTGIQFDLPTDAQWEFAARGGETEYHSYYNKTNSSGDYMTDAKAIDDIAWFAYNSTNRFFTTAVDCPHRTRTLVNGATPTPHGVGQKKPNGFGLYDMLGNIAEFTLDAYKVGSFPNDATIHYDPTGVAITANTFDVLRLTRGGTFNSAPINLRVARNSGGDLGTTYADSAGAWNLVAVTDAIKKSGFPTRGNGFRLCAPCHAVK